MTPRFASLPARLVALSAGPIALSVVLAVLTAREVASAPAVVDAQPDRPSADSGDASRPDAPKDLGPPAPPLPVVDGAKPDVSKTPKSDAPSFPEVGKPIPADPSPLAAEAVFILSVRFNKGVVTIEKAKRQPLAKKEALPRYMGRFAVELFVGPTLIERLRFDFPLIADDSNVGDSYAKGLDTTIDVKVPDSDRPTRMEIWDRATDKRWVFAYPPKTSP